MIKFYSSISNLLLLSTSLALVIFISELGVRWFDVEEVPVGKDIIDLAELKFNDSKIGRGARPEEFRVLSFGDSFAWGPVRYDFTYHAVAAELLNILGKNQTFRFVNLGEPSTSFKQYVRNYRHWGRIIEHDAVLFTVFLGNDLLEVSFGNIPDDRRLNASLKNLSPNIEMHQLSSRIPSRYPLRLLDYAHAWIALTSAKTENLGGEVIEKSPYHSFAIHLSEAKYSENSYNQLINFDRTQLPTLQKGYSAFLQLVELASEVRQSGKRVAIMLAPNELQVDEQLQTKIAERYSAKIEEYDFALPEFLLREIVKRVDPRIPVLNLSGSFEEGIKRGHSLYFGRNTHWSVEGNKLAGICVAKFLAKHWFSASLSIEDTLSELADYQYSHVSQVEKRDERKRLVEQFVPQLFAVEKKKAIPIQEVEFKNLVSESFADYSIDAINGKRVTFSEDRKVAPMIDVSSNGIRISGWAVDSMAKTLASKVFVEINGKIFTANYGIPRLDVAKSLSNSSYNDSGYTLQLKKNDVSTGTVSIRLAIVSADNKKYFYTPMKYFHTKEIQ